MLRRNAVTTAPRVIALTVGNNSTGPKILRLTLNLSRAFGNRQGVGFPRMQAVIAENS